MKSYDPPMHSAEHILNQTMDRMFNLNKLPADHGNEIRIISVGNYDQCPCIGTHVQNSSEIGLFELVSTSFEEGVLRIRFKLK